MQCEEIFSCGVRVITKQIGTAIIVDVIKFDPVLMEVIVRVKERYVISAFVSTQKKFILSFSQSKSSTTMCNSLWCYT